MNANADGKILVAGASRGIGLATAKMLLKRGYGVIASSRNIDVLKEAFASDENVEIIACDFSDVDSIANFAERVNKEAGPIDGLVYTAGMQLTMPISMNKPNNVKKIFALNTFAPIELIRCFAKKKMTAEKGASFVLISSLSAHEGSIGQSLYGATKGALEGFLAPASAELAARNIRLNVVTPGMVLTDMSLGFMKNLSAEKRENIESSYPLGLGAPEDAASLIHGLLSPESKWATGQSYIIDGGHMVRG